MITVVVPGLVETLLVPIFGELFWVCLSAKAVANVVEIFADGTTLKFEEVVVKVLEGTEAGPVKGDVVEETETACCLAINCCLGVLTETSVKAFATESTRASA